MKKNHNGYIGNSLMSLTATHSDGGKKEGMKVGSVPLPVQQNFIPSILVQSKQQHSSQNNEEC